MKKPRKKKDPRDFEFVMVEADNWEGLYVNGILVEEGHCSDVDLIGWLRKYGLNISFKSAYNDPEVQQTGTLPQVLKGLKFDK